ncbi:hypothetical protein NECAME_16407 [Necator americanus]|uniref:Uncharacterized protein n=1 Tax=Necator americanus TaxID=51031 RepID=W2TW81_NECAM|nr:hypothetical protein NECAME_16407 [Necator americanus]ETN86325.1 hypothetical protein NECAME_16407 [Necator americanus]
MVFAGITAGGKTLLWFVSQGAKVSSQNNLDLLKDRLVVDCYPGLTLETESGPISGTEPPLTKQE